MPIDVLHSLQIIEVLENFIEKIRPAENIRHEVDIAYKIDNQSVIIYELRPAWNKPDEIRESDIAKAIFVKSANCWKVFWKRADMKWHSYAPHPAVKTIDKFVQLVDEDEHSCFWG